MDKQNTYNGILLVIIRNEKLIHATTGTNLINVILSERNGYKRNQILHDSIYMKYPEKSNLYRQKVEW